jgi:hypothetical protein
MNDGAGPVPWPDTALISVDGNTYYKKDLEDRKKNTT